MFPTVLYHNPAATPALRRMVEEYLPAGWTLLVTGQDGEPGELLPRCDFLVVADRPVTAADLAQAPRLRMIQHQGVGYEKINLAACRERRIVVGLTPEGTSTGVAEHTILLILAVYKQLVKAATGVMAGRWQQWELRQTSFELAGKKLGLIGAGRIGQEVARRALAFDAELLYFDPFVSSPPQLEMRRVDTMQELLRSVDIVSLHVPSTRENYHLIDAAALHDMRPQAVLINTARGSLVDESALAAALREGRLLGAGLDVLEREPPAPDHPLLTFENVLITPHIAAGTQDAFRAKMQAVFANLQRCAGQQPLQNVVPELKELSECR